MKPIKFFVGTAMAVLLFGVNVAQAQFTLLPSVDDDVDCNATLQEFELVGSFKDASIRSAQVAINGAQEGVNEAKAVLDSAQDEVDNKRDALQNCQQATGDPTFTMCEPEHNAYKKAVEGQKNAAEKLQSAQDYFDSVNASSGGAAIGDVVDDSQYRDAVLACAIQTGRISLSMIPYFIKYIADFLLGLSGLVAVLFFVVGGYFYIWGGLTDNKEKGKKTVINAIIGLIIALLSWAIVSMIIATLTS